MKKGRIWIFLAFALFMAIIGGCSLVRASLGIAEPQESKESVRRKITSAVDKASSEIISSLPKGIKLAVMSSSSSLQRDEEFMLALFKSVSKDRTPDREFRAQIQNLRIETGEESSSDFVALLRTEEGSQLLTELGYNGDVAALLSEGTTYADYAVEDVEYQLVKAEFELVDRQQIERIRTEQQFQISGEVYDESAVRVGKMTGANAVIIITVNESEGSGRATLKALDVQSAEIIAMAKQEF
jgi:hypothetical protein